MSYVHVSPPSDFDLFKSSSDEEDEGQSRKRAPPAASDALNKRSKTRITTPPPPPQSLATPTLRAADSYQDAEGYYVPEVGERIGGRYRVLSGLCGKGIFSCVLRCVDNYGGEVAIKCIRLSDFTRESGLQEVDKLKRLHERDPLGNRPIVKYIEHFDHYGHLCIVCDAHKYNLRTYLKACGKGSGIPINRLQRYSEQMMEALAFLKECHIVHADIKPDNILVSDDDDHIKLCDLGSALYKQDIINAITDIVPRYYRAPEVYLGAKFSYGIDMWAMMCTLYELATGRFLFTSTAPAQMLLEMIKLKGRFSNKAIKLPQETQLPLKPEKTMLDLLLQNNKNLREEAEANSEIMTKVKELSDFLERGLALDASKRMTPEEGLEHPWIRHPFPCPP